MCCWYEQIVKGSIPKRAHGFFYGMKKGVVNSMKNPELIELFPDNVISFTEGNNTSE